MKNEDIIINKLTIDKENDICEELKKSIETLILYRSLYILKKKFELGKETIRKIYNSFNLDPNENVSKYCSYQVSIDNFLIIAKTVFEKCNMLLIIMNNPKDILLSNLFLDVNKKVEEMISILKEIKEYIINGKNPLVKKYNILYYDKKIKARMLKDALEKNQDKTEKKIKLKEGKSIINKEEVEIKEELKDEEIQRKIVEYNRKGKIIKTYGTNSNEEKNKVELNSRNNKNKLYIQSKENDLIKEKEERQEEEILDKNINLIDIENDKNYDNILYIETLPLIIADFIQQFTFYCIIETEDELNEELSILFDKELIEKINKYEESVKSKNDKIINKEFQSFLLKKNKIENNIRIYENLINEKKIKGENTSYLENMLEKLLMNNMIIQNKLSELISQNKNILNNDKEEIELNNINKNNNIESNFETSNITNISRVENNNNSISNSKIVNLRKKNKLNKVRIKPIIKSKLDTNIKYDKSKISNKVNKADTKLISSIKEIFNFYSRQHNSIGAKLLFSDLEKNMAQIGSSEFYKFCVEFNIPITRLRANDIFKKALTLSTSTYHKLRLMNFDEFLISLKLISKEISQNKLDLIRKNIENEKIKLNEIEEKQKKQRELEKYNNSINLGNKSNKNKMIFDKSEFYYQCERKKFTNEIFNLENKYLTEKEKPEEEIFNNFLNYLGINSTNDYKKKFKGFLLPFQTHEKKGNLIKVKHGIGSRLELELIEASKIFALQKEERMKISLTKEMVEKRNKFEEKKRLFKIKNEKLIKDIEKNENRKYSDKLIDLRNEINRKRMERLEMQKKEEYERKNIISWNRLENINMNSLDVDEIEKICNDTNNSDEEIINKISDENHKFKKSIQKNNSAFQLISKNNNLNFPKISKKTSVENSIINDNEFDNKNSLFNNY